MNWKAGDTAIICNCKKYPEWNGEMITVQSTPFIDPKDGVMNRLSQHSDWWDVRSDSKDVYSREVCFRKPYDGNELCEWKDCVFQPRELVVTT